MVHARKIAWGPDIDKEEIRMTDAIRQSELLLNTRGAIYHLDLVPGELSSTIIFVGDPERVSRVSSHFESIELTRVHREFVTHTGFYRGQRISVVSTGIGTDNIDIVLNECDALHNVDFSSRLPKANIEILNFLRLGTCGGLQKAAEVDCCVLSEFAIGVDQLMSFYDYQASPEEKQLQECVDQYFATYPMFRDAYVVKSDKAWSSRFYSMCPVKGITFTATGFYGPQRRSLRTPLAQDNFMQALHSFDSPQGKITNIEMETAGIYGLANLLGHQACSISTVIDNTVTDKVTENPARAVDEMIKKALDLI